MAEASEPPEGSAHSGELVYWWSPRGEERVFELPDWPEEAVAMARAVLADEGVEHRWEGTTIVAAAEARDDVAAVLDEVVAAAAPRLDEAADRTAYDFEGWPEYEVEVLAQALEDEEIDHQWDDWELVVYEADEPKVDALLERLGLQGPDGGVELDGDELIVLLTRLFGAADRLARDPAHADSVIEGHGAISEVEQLAVPYGMEPDQWNAFVADASALRELLEAEAERLEDAATDDAVQAQAVRVRDRLRAIL